MAYYGVRRFRKLVWKISKKTNGVELVWIAQIYIYKSLVNQGLRALHSHGLQNPNNENNQSLVVLDSKPIARLFFIIFFTVFYGFSLL